MRDTEGCAPEKLPPAPSDAKASRTWYTIMALAEPAGLIVSAYGGVATLAIPEEQRKAGVRASVLAAARMSETQ